MILPPSLQELLRTFREDRLNVALLLVIVVVFILMLGRMIGLWRTLGSEFKRAHEAVLTGNKPDLRASALVRAATDNIVMRHADDQRAVLRRSATDILQEYADQKMAGSRAFSMGGSLTGLALICTFVLIALVLTVDIKDAVHPVQSSEKISSAPLAGGAAATQQLQATREKADQAERRLAHGIGLLGAKFLISAVGILLNLVHLFVARSLRGRILGAAARVGNEIDEGSILLDAQEVMDRKTTIELLSGQLEQLKNLGSIKVSVQDMGSEVTANLGRLMKETVGDEIQNTLRQMMGTADDISRRLEENLKGALAETLGRELAQVRESLQAVQKSIESQAAPQIERIVDQMRDMVSGGFQNESAQLAIVLREFVKVVPELEKNLRAITGTVTDDLRQRSEESRHMASEVLTKVTALATAMEQQQVATAAAVDRISESSTRAAHLLTQDVARAGAEVVEGLVRSSHEQVTRFFSQIETLTSSNAGRYADVERQLVAVAESVGAANVGLTDASTQVAGIAGALTTLLKEMLKQTGAAREQLDHFSSSSTAMTRSLGQLQQLSEATMRHIADQQALIKEQREYATHVEGAWPTMFDRYLQAFKEHSSELARSWKAVHEDVRKLAEASASGFTGGVSELVDAVDRLERLIPKPGPGV